MAKAIEKEWRCLGCEDWVSWENKRCPRSGLKSQAVGGISAKNVKKSPLHLLARVIARWTVRNAGDILKENDKMVGELWVGICVFCFYGLFFLKKLGLCVFLGLCLLTGIGGVVALGWVVVNRLDWIGVLIAASMIPSAYLTGKHFRHTYRLVAVAIQRQYLRSKGIDAPAPDRTEARKLLGLDD